MDKKVLEALESKVSYHEISKPTVILELKTTNVETTEYIVFKSHINPNDLISLSKNIYYKYILHITEYFNSDIDNSTLIIERPEINFNTFEYSCEFNGTDNAIWEFTFYEH